MSNSLQTSRRIPARRSLRLVLLPALATLAACDEATLEESRATCERSCARWNDCQTEETTADNCVDACMGDIEQYAQKDCRDTLLGFLECTATLTCAELVSWTPDAVPSACDGQYLMARVACSSDGADGGGE